MRMACIIVASLVILFVSVAFAQAKTCQYQTDWGVMTIDFRAQSVQGTYPHKKGWIRGSYAAGDVVQGTWGQSDGGGQFYFKFTRGGFTGYWKYSSDPKWRGNWNGSLLNCY